MQEELVQWQRIDPSNGLIEPWLTHPAIDEIKSWELADKQVLEYGAGMSTLWWAHKCKHVISIEANEGWFDKLQNHPVRQTYHNLEIFLRVCNEGDQSKIDFYTAIPDTYRPDIVIVDGILRYECILKAMTLPRPLTLIVDNWQQDFIFMCPAADELMKDYKAKIFPQPGHTDHEGHPWQTAIWELK